MSLQVCHCCGWSKVTTYQGLRIHQGRMGCTPKGMRIAEPEQQYMWGYVGPPKVQMDLKVDVRTSFKTETKVYHSDQSLQVCHCGWTKMTTYQGLRIHQGKMGCTTKGIRIPKKEQYDWKYDEVDYIKHPQTIRVGIKNETSPEAPRMSNRREEHKSPANLAPQHSSQRARTSKSKPSTYPQVNRPVREHLTPARVHQVLPENSFGGDTEGFWGAECNNNYAATAFRSKEEPVSPPDMSYQARERLRDFSSDVQVYMETPTAPAVRPKQRDWTDQTPSLDLVREPPPTLQSAPVVQPKEKHRKDPTCSLANRSVREQPSSLQMRDINRLVETAHEAKRSVRKPRLAPPVVLHEDKDGASLEMLQEKSDSEFRKETQDYLLGKKRREKLRDGDRPAETGHKANLPVQRFSANPVVQLKEEDILSQGNRSVRKQPSAPPLVPPSEKDAPAFMPKPYESQFLQDIQNMLQRINKTRAEKGGIQPLELDSENVSVSPRIDSSAAGNPEDRNSSFTSQNTKCGRQLEASAAAEQANRSVSDQISASPLSTVDREFSDAQLDKEICDYLQGNKTTAEKLKDIIRPEETAHERTDSPTKGEFTEENKSSSSPQRSKKLTNPKSDMQLRDFSAAEQVTKSIAKRSNAPPAVPPKRKDSASFRVEQSETQIVKDTPNNMTTAVAEVSRKEEPALSHDPAKSGASSSLKVKELARMFSDTTAQEKPSQSKGFRDGHKRSQDATRMNTITHKAAASKIEEPSSSCKAAQSQFSTSIKVKELARMFSAQEVAVRPDETHKEDDKPSQVKILAQKCFPATIQRTAVQTTEKDRKEEKLAQKKAEASGIDTKINLAASQPPTEEPKSCGTTQLSGFSSGLTVKDLARMFSAVAMQEESVRTKKK